MILLDPVAIAGIRSVSVGDLTYWIARSRDG